MRSRMYIAIIGCSIVIALIGLLMFNFSNELKLMESGQVMFNYSLRIGAFTGLVLMVTNGTFIKTRYFKIAQGCFAIILIGALTKILHWTSYANAILVT